MVNVLCLLFVCCVWDVGCRLMVCILLWCWKICKFMCVICMECCVCLIGCRLCVFLLRSCLRLLNGLWLMIVLVVWLWCLKCVIDVVMCICLCK